MRIALFGGAFDPPTYGHVLAITVLLNSSMVDAVWLVPTGDRTDKGLYASGVERLEMLKLLRQVEFNESSVEVVDWQVSGILSNSFTIDLMEYATASYPDHVFYFTIGADIPDVLQSWKRSDDLLRRFKFFVLPRGATCLSQNLPDYLIPLQVDESLMTAISSSAARRLIEANQCVAGVVPSVVMEYVRERGLYKGCKRSRDLTTRTAT